MAAARSRRRGRGGHKESAQANDPIANPLLSRQDRDLFRRAVAGVASTDASTDVSTDVADGVDAATPEPPPTVTDAALFAQAVTGAVPLAVDRVAAERQRPAPLPLQGQQLLHAAEHDLQPTFYGGFDGEVAERLWFARSGLQDRVLRKLRRGHLRPEAELDLHGMIVAEAHQAVDELIQEALVREVRCVRIIHGKGKRSLSQQPVLKGNLDRWLRSRDEVLAFSSAPREQGGSGAVLVLLRRQ